MRLFQTLPKWAALNRGEETEENQFRKDYVLARAKGFAKVTQCGCSSAKSVP